MTREEAMQVLRHIIQVADTSDCGIKEIDGTDVEAIDMAIKALEHEPCDDAISRQYLLDNCVMDKVIMPYVPINRIENAPSVNPVPCEDAISRQAVLDLLQMKYFGKELYMTIYNMPSVTPQPKTGWIPVSERLPKSGEYIGNVAKYYLIQNEYGDMLVARYRHSEYWEQIYQMKPIAAEVVAWMPLPKPYEPQESEVEDGSTN